MSTLTIDVTTDAAAAAAEMDHLADSARGVGTAVESAGAQVQTGAARIDSAASSADNLDSKSSALTGSLGALAAGFELVGAEQYAGALQGASMATDFLSGAGGLLSLVLETQAAKWIVSTAAQVGATVAQTAATVATGAQTAAQWALNAALNANPIGLIVLAIAALVGGLILAYKNSETFREVVDGAFTRAKVVVEQVVEVVKDVAGWFSDLPGIARDAWSAVSSTVGDAIDSIVGWFRDLPGAAREAWEGIKQAVGEKIDDAKQMVTDLIDLATRLPREAAGEVAGYFSDFFAPIRDAIGWVEDLIAKIKSIDFPDLNPLGRVADVLGRGDSTRLDGLPASGPQTVVTIPLTVQGAIDKDGTARTVTDTLTRYFGRNPDFTSVSFG